jgi:hypothetical protein
MAIYVFCGRKIDTGRWVAVPYHNDTREQVIKFLQSQSWWREYNNRVLLAEAIALQFGWIRSKPLELDWFRDYITQKPWVLRELENDYIQHNESHELPRAKTKPPEVPAECRYSFIEEYLDPDGFIRTFITHEPPKFDPEAAWKATKLAAGDAS